MGAVKLMRVLLLGVVVVFLGGCVLPPGPPVLQINAFAGGGASTAEPVPAPTAQISWPFGIAVATDGDTYLASEGDGRIRKVEADDGTISTIAGTGVLGFAGDGGPATAAKLNAVYGLELDSAGNLFAVDAGNGRIRRIDATTGVITTVAGNGGSLPSSDPATTNVNALTRTLAGGFGIEFGPDGRLYIADWGGIWALDLGTGRMDLIAGKWECTINPFGFPQHQCMYAHPPTTADPQAAAGAVLQVTDLAFDTNGDLYIGGWGEARIRMIAAGTSTLSTIAGTGTYGFAGDNGPATAAQLQGAMALEIDAPRNRLLFNDRENNRVRAVDLATGTMSTIAGTGAEGDGGDGGPASDATFSGLAGLATRPDGTVLVGQGVVHDDDLGMAIGRVRVLS